MARIRYLKPDFFKDEDLAELPFEVRLFYQGLWCQADKAGRLEDRPKRLKVEIFPYDNVNIEKCLVTLAKNKANSGKPFINRYTTDKQRYIQILTWREHQRPHHTEKTSAIPECHGNGDGNGDGDGNGKGNGKAAQSELVVKEPLFNGVETVKTDTLMTLFDSARKAYPGKKRGLDTEWANFKKKCTDWKDLLEVRNGQCALEWVIGKQITAKLNEKRETGFTSNWSAFSVWINQRKFEEYLE